LVTATEVRYILARKYDRETADVFLEWLWTIGTSQTEAGDVWERAADYVVEYNPALAPRSCSLAERRPAD
jgi:hypothetical protein